MSEHIEWQELHELLKELAQKEYGDKYGEQIFWYFQDVIDDSCKLDVLEEENERLNNIINTMLDFNFFKEECPLNFGYIEKCDEEKAQDVFYEDAYCEENCNDDYKKCWLKYFERLQELKGSEK